jgi:hypothetical protein
MKRKQSQMILYLRQFVDVGYPLDWVADDENDDDAEADLQGDIMS